MVTGLLKPWAVWLLNKRAAVPAVGTGKPQRWLPGTRGSRLVSVSPCPPSPLFFLLCPALLPSCSIPPVPCPQPKLLGVCPVLCPVPCSLLHGSAVPHTSGSGWPQGLDHAPRAQTWDVLPPRTGKTAPMHPPQLPSLLRHVSSCRKCRVPESPGGDGCSALSLAAPLVALFGSMSPIFLPSPPSTTATKNLSSVPLCSKTRFSPHSCFPASSTLCYPPSTERSLAWHQPACGVTGQPRDPRPRPGSGTRLAHTKALSQGCCSSIPISRAFHFDTMSAC